MLWLVIDANELIDDLLLNNNDDKNSKKKMRSNLERFKSKLTCFLGCVVVAACILLSPWPSYPEQLACGYSLAALCTCIFCMVFGLRDFKVNLTLRRL